MIRPRVLVDCDGVLVNSTHCVLRALSSMGIGEFSHDDVTDWSYTQCLWITPEEEAAAWASVERWDIHRLPEYPGAVEGVRELRSFADVIFVTAPSPHIPTWTWHRDRWLTERFPGVPVVHTSHKELVAGDAIIDDRESNVTAWQRAHPGGLGILWARPWNQDAVRGLGIARTDDWNVAAALLRPQPPSELERIALGRAP